MLNKYGITDEEIETLKSKAYHHDSYYFIPFKETEYYVYTINEYKTHNELLCCDLDTYVTLCLYLFEGVTDAYRAEYKQSIMDGYAAAKAKWRKDRITNIFS